MKRPSTLPLCFLSAAFFFFPDWSGRRLPFRKSPRSRRARGQNTKLNRFRGKSLRLLSITVSRFGIGFKQHSEITL